MANCKQCGRTLETYYVEWCPNCDKPHPVAYTTLNMIKALRYIEVALKQEGYKRRMWDLFCENFEVSNGIYLVYYRPECDVTEQDQADLDLFEQTFNVQNFTKLLLHFDW